MTETAFGAALKKASANIANMAELAVLAYSELRKKKLNPVAAHDAFADRVLSDADLLKQLIKEQFGFDAQTLRQGALHYLQARAKDMKGPPVKQNGDGVGQKAVGAHFANAPSSPDPIPGEGHVLRDAHIRGADSRNPDHEQGSGHPPDAAQRGLSAPAREPSRQAIAARGAASKVIAVTVLDTYKLATGSVVGDVYWSSLHRLRANSARDAALLQQIINFGVPPDPHAKVRDYLPAEVLQRMIQKAAEMSDAV